MNLSTAAECCCSVAEDGLADTVRSAHRRRRRRRRQIAVLEAVREGETDRLVNLAADLAVIEVRAEAVPAVLVVIDPLTAYLGAVDSYKDAKSAACWRHCWRWRIGISASCSGSRI